jgi:hypothetical protein
MIRRAILIAASRVPGEDILPGAERDIANLTAWLTSNDGGAWSSDEIYPLLNPNRGKVRRAMELASVADYAFVSYSGHGFARGDDFEDMSICLTDVSPLASILLPSARRGTVVVDACRTIMPDLVRKGRETLGGFREEVANQRRLCRALFDKRLLDCEQGLIVVCSCAPGQAAGESPRGGFFTRGLVEGATQWSENNRNLSVLSIREATDLAEEFARERNPQQQPQYLPGRRREHFPFAIAP